MPFSFPQSKGLGALRIKAFSRSNTRRFSNRPKNQLLTSRKKRKLSNNPAEIAICELTQQHCWGGLLLGTDKCAGLLDLRHLPYVSDDFVQLPQGFGFYSHNYVVKAVGNEGFCDLFCSSDFLGCVMLFAALHGGNHVGFHSFRHNNLTLTIVYSLEALSVFKQQVIV
jgi:hypothetical protein